MSYIIKPSVGMMPLNDLSKVMEAEGFVKDLKADDIEKATKDPGNPSDTGIQEPWRIAVCAYDNATGTFDRETVDNALNLGGIEADRHLIDEDRTEINDIITKVSRIYSEEVSFLRMEIYNLKQELAKIGKIEDTSVANGYIDAFRKNNIKYSLADTEISSVQGNNISVIKPILSTGRWIGAKLTKAGTATDVSNVTAEGNGFRVDMQGLQANESVLHETLGQYKAGTFSFSETKTDTPGGILSYVSLTDDSNVKEDTIKFGHTGFAFTVKIPSRSAGFLEGLRVYGTRIGSPAPLDAYLIDGGPEYLESIKDEGLSAAIKDNKLIPLGSVSDTAIEEGKASVIHFDLTNRINITDMPSIPIEDKIYSFVVSCGTVSQDSYWRLEFGSKKVSGVTVEDLQTNNKLFSFNDLRYNSNLGSTVAIPAFEEIYDVDMLHTVITSNRIEMSETPYTRGIYTTAMDFPATGTRATLILEVNKEGVFSSGSNGMINPDSAITISNADGKNYSAAPIIAGDKVIIGQKIGTVNFGSTDEIQLTEPIYVENGWPVYRCGYEAQLITFYKNKDDGTLSNKRITPMVLAGVIPTGRKISSAISDKLIFEANLSIDVDQEPDFNCAELQIKWKTGVPAGAISSAAINNKIDFYGRIHGMTVAFDRNIGTIADTTPDPIYGDICRYKFI